MHELGSYAELETVRAAARAAYDEGAEAVRERVEGALLRECSEVDEDGARRCSECQGYWNEVDGHDPGCAVHVALCAMEAIPATEGEWQPGDLVWYAPSEGVRFAGVVKGEGTLPQTHRVQLCAAYWYWKGATSPSGGRSAAAVAASRLSSRGEHER